MNHTQCPSQYEMPSLTSICYGLATDIIFYVSLVLCYIISMYLPNILPLPFSYDILSESVYFIQSLIHDTYITSSYHFEFVMVYL